MVEKNAVNQLTDEVLDEFEAELEGFEPTEKPADLAREASSHDFFSLATSYEEGPIVEKYEEFRRSEKPLLVEVVRLISNVNISGNLQQADVLECRTMDNILVYVSEKNAGLYQPRDLKNMIGQQKYATIVNNFKDPYNNKNQRSFFLGSIQSGEYITGKRLYQSMKRDPEAFKSKERTGIISQIFYNSDPNKEGIFINYAGFNFFMHAHQVNYNSRGTKNFTFDRDLVVGQNIQFLIQDVKEVDSKKESGNGYKLEGKFYSIASSRKKLLETPYHQVKNLRPGDSVIGYVTGVHGTQGMFVEVAPNITWKLNFNRHTRPEQKPTTADALENTEVVCEVLSSVTRDNYQKNKVRFVKFVKGPSTNIDIFSDNYIF